MSRNASLVARTVSHLTNAAAESASMLWAESLAKDFEKLLTASEANEAALLSAIGMARHEKLVVLRKRVLDNGVGTLNALEDKLKKEMYLSPGSQEPTAADAVLAWSAREVVDFVLEPSDRVYEYPSSNRWLAAVLSHDAFQKAYKEELAHAEVLDSDAPTRVVRGEVREGGMIDAKPRATDARRAAEKVKALNAGYKKQQTQRQKEKDVAAATTTPEVQAALVTEFTLGDKIPSSDPAKIQKCMEMVAKAANVVDLERVDHAPAKDASDLSEALASKSGIKCKNLFLKCKKPRNESDSGLQLVCCPVDRAVDLKLVQTQLGYKDQLRFAQGDVLEKTLDVTQGNVTPFALVNDPERLVNVVLDQEMMANQMEILWFHPLDNTASIGIPAGKLLEFIKASGRIASVLPLTTTGSVTPPVVVAAASKDDKQAKKSSGRGGEGAPVPTKKAATSSSSSPKTMAPVARSSSFSSPPTTVEEALAKEEQALSLVQARAAEMDQAKTALEQARGTPGAAEAEKLYKQKERAKKEADMIYGNAAGFTEKMREQGKTSKKTNNPAPIKTTESPQASPKKAAAVTRSSSFSSPPTTVEEALAKEEQALSLVQERAIEVDQAKAALDQAKATSGGDVAEAEKLYKQKELAKKEADMIYGNAAGFTAELREKSITSSAAATASAPLVFTLTHELAQDRLWARLDKILNGARPKRLEGTQDETAQRPVGHSTHNLLVKDSKTKRLYMVCMRQDRQMDLKTLGEKLGCQATPRLAGPADVETAIALTRGCITPLSLYNNSQASVTPVFDEVLLAEPDKKLVICAGCDDPHKHAQHNCVQISVKDMLQLINEAGPREHMVLQFQV